MVSVSAVVAVAMMVELMKYRWNAPVEMTLT